MHRMRWIFFGFCLLLVGLGVQGLGGCGGSSSGNDGSAGTSGTAGAAAGTSGSSGVNGGISGTTGGGGAAGGAGSAGISGSAGGSSGSSGTGGSSTSASVSLRISNNPTHSQDAYTLTFTRFELNFTEVAFANYTTTSAYSAEMASGPATHIVTVTNLLADSSYSQVTLSLDTAHINATAVSGSHTCNLEIIIPGTIGPLILETEEPFFAVTGGQSNTLSLTLRSDTLFSAFDVPSRCTGGADVVVTSAESLALKANFLAEGVLEQ